MQEILSFAPAIVNRIERSWNGITACRTVRAAWGAHEFRMLQSRHVIALQLSTAPIRSADRLDDTRWPTRTRAVGLRITVVPAGAEWISQTEAQAASEYVAVFVPDRFIDSLEQATCLRKSIRPVLDAELPGVRRVMQAIGDDLYQSLHGDLFLDGAVRLLLTEIARADRYQAMTRRSAGDLSFRQMARLDEFLEAQLHEPMTVHGLAQDLGVSESALARATQRWFGLTPYQLVLERRIQRARRLLVDCDDALACIGARCGFDDQSHFTTAFRKRVGLSPGRFRSQRRP